MNFYSDKPPSLIEISFESCENKFAFKNPPVSKLMTMSDKSFVNFVASALALIHCNKMRDSQKVSMVALWIHTGTRF